MTISLELAGALVPMSGEKLGAIAFALSPGIDGIAARRGDRIGAIFPGQILRRNTDSARAITSLTGAIAGDARAGLEPIDVLLERGYVYYRFRTIHVAQPAPGAAAVFLHRGGRVIDRREITLASIREFADALANRIERSAWPGVEPFGVLGAYDPIQGRQRDRLASPIEQAMSALALARYARTPGVTPENVRRADRYAIDILQDLALVAEGEDDPRDDLLASAACVIALSEIDAEVIEQSDRLTSLLECRVRLEAARGADGAFEASVPSGALGLLALAAVRAVALGPVDDPIDARAQVVAAVVAAYARTPPGLLVTQMPWLGWASMELADRLDEPIAGAAPLREMRRLVWEHQLRVDDLESSELDLVGGIVFTKSPMPLPTWHGARPLAFLATMLGDGLLTPGGASSGEVPGEIGRLLDSLRFLRQLAAGESEGHMYRDPARAMWGVRNTLWDQDMEPGSSAMVLLTLCETLESVDRIGRRSRAD